MCPKMVVQKRPSIILHGNMVFMKMPGKMIAIVLPFSYCRLFSLAITCYTNSCRPQTIKRKRRERPKPVAPMGKPP